MSRFPHHVVPVHSRVTGDTVIHTAKALFADVLVVDSREVDACRTRRNLCGLFGEAFARFSRCETFSFTFRARSLLGYRGAS